MNKKLFGRDDSQRQLAELYRAVEEAAEVRVVDPALREALDADQQLMRQLGHLAARSGPVNPAIGRATLLSELARKKSHAPEKERTTMIGKLLTTRGLALLATAGIFAGGAVTVGASGGVSGAAGNVNNVLAALHVTDRTPDQADSHVDDIAQPDGSGKPADVPAATPGAGLSNAEQHGLDNAAEGSDNAGQGIDNASQKGLDNANSNATDGPTANAGASDNSQPVALPTQASDNASEGGDNGAVPLPTEASDHASERGANGTGN